MKSAMILGLTAAAVLLGSTEPTQTPAKMAERYDGRWWLASSAERRSGFLEGVADCLTWVVRVEGFSETSNELIGKVTNYYETHPDERRALIVDVWPHVGARASGSKPGQGGEVWKNPHWYLNGLWWRQSSEMERSGFVEGFLSCLRARSGVREGVYSRPAGWYILRISRYVDAHPRADDEPVATILEHLKDRPQKE